MWRNWYLTKQQKIQKLRSFRQQSELLLVSKLKNYLCFIIGFLLLHQNANKNTFSAWRFFIKVGTGHAPDSVMWTLLLRPRDEAPSVLSMPYVLSEMEFQYSPASADFFPNFVFLPLCFHIMRCTTLFSFINIESLWLFKDKGIMCIQ